MFLKQQARALVNVIIVGEFIYTSFCDAIYIIYISQSYTSVPCFVMDEMHQACVKVIHIYHLFWAIFLLEYFRYFVMLQVVVVFNLFHFTLGFIHQRLSVDFTRKFKPFRR